jgi:Rrf2 family protein
MRLEVTRRTDLATRALLTLAARGERMKAAELAEALEASSGFLSQAMTPLVGRGWVRSDPGPAGGYTTSVDLDAISVLDVVEALEGPTDEARCVLEDRDCGRGRGDRCAMHDAWVHARNQLLRQLAVTQLSSIPTPRT